MNEKDYVLNEIRKELEIVGKYDLELFLTIIRKHGGLSLFLDRVFAKGLYVVKK